MFKLYTLFSTSMIAAPASGVGISKTGVNNAKAFNLLDKASFRIANLFIILLRGIFFLIC